MEVSNLVLWERGISFLSSMTRLTWITTCNNHIERRKATISGTPSTQADYSSDVPEDGQSHKMKAAFLVFTRQPTADEARLVREIGSSSLVLLLDQECFFFSSSCTSALLRVLRTVCVLLLGISFLVWTLFDGESSISRATELCFYGPNVGLTTNQSSWRRGLVERALDLAMFAQVLLMIAVLHSYTMYYIKPLVSSSTPAWSLHFSVLNTKA